MLLLLTLKDYLAEPKAEVPTSDLPSLLGEAERVKAELYTRLATPPFPPDGETGPLLDVAEAAAFLNVPKSYIYDLARQHKLPSVKVGKYLRFKRAELTAWLDKRAGGDAALDIPVSAPYTPGNGRSSPQTVTASSKAHSGRVSKAGRRTQEHSRTLGAGRVANQRTNSPTAHAASS